MRIVLVCPYDVGAVGGVQYVVGELAARLAADGDEAVVVGPGEVPGATGAVTIGRPATVRANGSRVPLTVDPRAPGRLRRLLRSADLVHVHEPFVPLAGWAALRTGRPTVATFHADPASWTRTLYRAAAPLGRWALAGASLSAVSPVAAGAVPWGAPTVIPNGLDTDAYRRKSRGFPDRVAFLGRDDPRKGLDVLLAAWPAVRREHPGATLIVMGAERSVSIPGVEFRGRVDEETKRAVLAESAVLVAPHRGGESFGIVLVEGMAAGCAVVASDLPAFRHVLAGAGVLVPPGDPGALAAALAGLLSDTDALSGYAAAATRRSADFDWTAVLAGYRAVYERALASARLR